MPDTTVVRMGPQGRIVVPADLRRELGLNEGSTMAASAEEGRLILEPRSVVLERLRRRFSGMPGSMQLADELIMDRRDETRNEDEH
jgi:AbrB family looped-hinge helix DNA binding protein